MAKEISGGTPRKHDLSVVYSGVVVPGDELVVTDWNAWTEDDQDGTHYYVNGPCPGCGAAVQGHAVDEGAGPIEPQGSDDVERPEGSQGRIWVEVPVSCTCGYGHGNDEAKNCGRKWVLELVKEGA